MNAAAIAMQLREVEPVLRYGFVRRVSPGRVEASGPIASIGDICDIETRDRAEEGRTILAEVVAVHEDRIVLVPLDQSAAILPDARVTARASKALAPVGDAFAGRAVDALGQPIDGGPTLLPDTFLPIFGQPIAPLKRREPNTILETGIRALDGLLTMGQGQRVGIFSASGVGKTTLIRQLATQVQCDHCVVCLVGERGREVQQMWQTLSQSPDNARYTCVAATSDLSAPLRARAVYQALCIAEYWRDAGKHVVLVLDSATRFAMALRDLGLAAGAPPTLRAYTPNVFSALPRLTERCGAVAEGGAITAIMTVLSETDEVDDPIVEVMKSLLDGHVILSRPLAEQGHYPAIDAIRSISRQSEKLTSPAHAKAARRAIALTATYDDARVLVDSGLYKHGVNAKLDEAIRERPALLSFLAQRQDEHASLAATLERLAQVTSRISSHG
ncbi:MAG: FliI/YscN family ATPase [Vitreimonas sp.]